MRTDCCDDYPECFHGRPPLSTRGIVMAKCDVYTTESCQENSALYANAYHPPERISMDQKLAAAREWLGDRYLCANPIQKRSKR